MGLAQDTIAAFLLMGGQAVAAVRDPEVGRRWDDPSCLKGYTVGGLVGHAARAVLTVDRYLASPQPPASAVSVSPATYVATVLGDDDPQDSDLHRRIRLRGGDESAPGPIAIGAALEATLARLAADLPDAAAQGHRVAVLDGLAMHIEDYLDTRIVELVVHLDDLAVSLGRNSVVADPAILTHVAGLLGQIAAARSEPIHVIRSLARRERHPDPVRAL